MFVANKLPNKNGHYLKKFDKNFSPRVEVSVKTRVQVQKDDQNFGKHEFSSGNYCGSSILWKWGRWLGACVPNWCDKGNSFPRRRHEVRDILEYCETMDGGDTSSDAAPPPLDLWSRKRLLLFRFIIWNKWVHFVHFFQCNIFAPKSSTSASSLPSLPPPNFSFSVRYCDVGGGGARRWSGLRSGLCFKGPCSLGRYSEVRGALRCAVFWGGRCREVGGVARWVVLWGGGVLKWIVFYVIQIFEILASKTKIVVVLSLSEETSSLIRLVSDCSVARALLTTPLQWIWIFANGLTAWTITTIRESATATRESSDWREGRSSKSQVSQSAHVGKVFSGRVACGCTPHGIVWCVPESEKTLRSTHSISCCDWNRMSWTNGTFSKSATWPSLHTCPQPKKFRIAQWD